MTMLAELVEAQARVAPPQGAQRVREEQRPGGGATREKISRPHPEASEVSERPRRRQFSAEYKLRVVEEAGRCRAKGEVGALLRREGLYSSLLTAWRREALQGLRAQRRGRKVTPPEQRRVQQLERENARLRQRLDQAELIIEVQKKVSALLGIRLPDDPRASEG